MSAKKLSARESAFVDEFLKDFNATAAARRAGYKATTDGAMRVAAYKVLHREHVAAELARRREVVATRNDLTTDRIIRGLLRIAEADVRKVFRADGGLKDLQDLDDDTAAAIAGVESEDIRVGKENIGAVRKVRRFDAVRAWELLGRIAGSFNDTLTVKGDFADRLVRARERARSTSRP